MRLPAYSELASMLTPVTLRPGRAKLDTIPEAIGSLVQATIGMVRVSDFKALPAVCEARADL